MVRKILEARDIFTDQVQNSLTEGKSLIRQIYLQLLGTSPRVPLKCSMFSNDARPKAKFTMWLHLQGKLTTTDRLLKWGINVDPLCVYCKRHCETKELLCSSIMD